MNKKFKSRLSTIISVLLCLIFATMLWLIVGFAEQDTNLAALITLGKLL